MHDRRAGAAAVTGPHLVDRRRWAISADSFIDDRALQRGWYLADLARRRDSRQGYCRSVVLRQVSKGRYRGFKVSRRIRRRRAIRVSIRSVHQKLLFCSAETLKHCSRVFFTMAEDTNLSPP